MIIFALGAPWLDVVWREGGVEGASPALDGQGGPEAYELPQPQRK